MFSHSKRMGGEGKVYRGKIRGSWEPVAVKIFNDRFNTKETRERVRYLSGLDLHSDSSVLYAPYDTIDDGFIGHCAKWAEGVPFESALENPEFDLMEALHAGVAISHGISLLHSKQIVYGDLHSQNIKVLKDGDVTKPSIFDLDNFSAPGLPMPSMIGQNLYIAPELRDAMKQEKPAVPDIGNDRFELAVILHELTYLRHPAAGYDDDPDRFHKAMCSGEWVQDRARSKKDHSRFEMLLTLGILTLFAGIILLAVSGIRILISRGTISTGNGFVRMLLAGFGLMALAVCMIHAGQKSASAGIPLGIIFFLIALLIIVLGVWLTFWGPYSKLNTGNGLRFIVIGIVLMTISVFSMVYTGSWKEVVPCLDTSSIDPIDWQYIFDRRIGPVPFGLYAIGLFILANGMALKKGLNFRQVVGINLITLAALVLLYAMAPALFVTW